MKKLLKFLFITILAGLLVLTFFIFNNILDKSGVKDKSSEEIKKEIITKIKEIENKKWFNFLLLNHFY